MLAHAAIGTVFDIPVVMTTSAETGLSPPLLSIYVSPVAYAESSPFPKAPTARCPRRSSTCIPTRP